MGVPRFLILEANVSLPGFNPRYSRFGTRRIIVGSIDAEPVELSPVQSTRGCNPVVPSGGVVLCVSSGEWGLLSWEKLLTRIESQGRALSTARAD